MSTECSSCKAPVARDDQRYCYQCGEELRWAQDSPDSRPEKAGDSNSIAALVITLPTGESFHHKITSNNTKLGKSPENDIVVADPAVSAFHATLEAGTNGFNIRDVGSRNGILVAGQRIEGARLLKDGDVIWLGRSKLVFSLPGEAGEKTEVTEAVPHAPPPATDDLLAKAVVAAGLIRSADAERLLRDESKKSTFYRKLVEEKLIEQEALRDLMSREFGIPVAESLVSSEPVPELPPDLLMELQVLPISIEGAKLVVAVSDPTDENALDKLRRHSKLSLEMKLATAAQIAERLDQHYGARLVCVLPTGEKVDYRLTMPEMTIGKATHNNIVLQDSTVSNTHAVVLASGSTYSIVDLESLNGTFVDGERLGSDARTLKHGDSIQLGKTILVFRSAYAGNENVTAILSEEALTDLRKRYPASGDSEQPEEKVKKKKKKKKKKDERIKAAYVGAISRVLAQILAVALTVALAVIVNNQIRSSWQSGSESAESRNGSGPDLKRIDGGTSKFKGGTYEASAAVQVAGAEGKVMFVDDGKADRVFVADFDESGKQVGASTAAIPLGVEVEDPEGLSYGAGYFYVIGSQANPAAGKRNALVRFVYDPNAGALVGSAEVITDFREFLVSRLPELGSGINIEGLAWDPNREQLLLGLRSPLAGSSAMIVGLKLRNPRGSFSTDNLAEPVVTRIGLAGGGVRDISYDSRLKRFLIISGSTEHHEKTEFRLWTWDGEGTPSQLEHIALDRDMKPEGIARIKIGAVEFVLMVSDSSAYQRLDYSQ